MKTLFFPWPLLGRRGVGRAAVFLVGYAALVLNASGQGPDHGRGQGKGMPEAERTNIHGLFDAHEKIKRKVKITERGYVSTTTSEDPEVARMLQAHVEQMRNDREGLRVRRWDPAFDESIAHYEDIGISIKVIAKGLRVTAVGKTEEAIAVARNHAKVISAFVENGWDEHHAEHPAALKQGSEAEGAASDSKKAKGKP